jgi:hypothetical protein
MQIVIVVVDVFLRIQEMAPERFGESVSVSSQVVLGGREQSCRAD